MRYGNIVILASALFLWSCNETESRQLPGEPEQEQTVNRIAVTRAAFERGGQRADGVSDGDDISDKNNWRYNTPDNMLPGGDEEEFPEEGRMFIAQITPTRTPNFPTNWSKSKKYDNLWVYKKDASTDADGASWSSGYNFVPFFEDHSKLDWKTVKSQGSLGNAFSFYAMYYPGGAPIAQLKQQQSIWPIDTIKAMDVMGAYHATPSLYSRMRFRFFHLMAYIRVTVYVPVVQPRRDKNGEIVGYDGFGKKAFDPTPDQGVTNGRPLVYVTSISGNETVHAGNKSIYLGFNVDWRANRSSDNEGPLLYGNSTLGHIAMHFHRDFDYDIKTDLPGFTAGHVDTQWGAYLTESGNPDSDVFEIDLSAFNIETDEPIQKVRRYEFSAILPPQSIASNKNLLRLILATPGVDELPEGDKFQGSTSQGTFKEFTFSIQDSKLEIVNSQVSLTSGSLQHFYLYVPRSGNKTIVMKANVVPWKHTQTDMTVTEETKEEPNPEEQQTK